MQSILSEYVAPLSIDRRNIINKLFEIILHLYPNSKISMKYKMPTFEAKAGWVAVANQKHYVSLYTCSYTHIEAFKINNPRIKTGKGCINFKVSEPLPVNDIKLVIRHAIENPKD